MEDSSAGAHGWGWSEGLRGGVQGVTREQELSKELEEEVHANRQRFEHIARTHDQQLKEMQQVRSRSAPFPPHR